jgi:primosomal protein DnaI
VFENESLVSFEFEELSKINSVKTNYFKIESFGTSPVIKDASLLTFNTSSSDRKSLLYETLIIIDKVMKKQENIGGLIIKGSTSTGKTYILSALAKELASLKKKVVFMYYSDLNRIMNSIRFDKSLESRIEILNNCDFLFIDGLATAKISSWFRDDCLVPLLNHRLINKKTTFFSTSVIDEKILMRKFNNDGYEFDIAQGITQMIYKLTKTVYLSHKYND